jgi:hypothetical protein
MAINFSQGTQIAVSGNSLNIPGSVIQVVNRQQTVSGSVHASAGWVTFLSASMSISKPGNRILVEYMMNNRSDQGNGTWSLVYNRVLVNGSQMWQGGHDGAAANYIGFYERSFLYTAPSAGTYTFEAQVLAHQGQAWIGEFNSGSTNHYLRLYEIGT